MNRRLTPRLATALFRRYLRAGLSVSPGPATPPAGAQPGDLGETPQAKQRPRY
ncbi:MULTISPECIES: hypothetical protein [unclassified Streptomyces]|uniref:hypothetical protein n=1 Tax=unclassified Streptomyces TaxID=2593676 RepID=UPI0036353F63